MLARVDRQVSLRVPFSCRRRPMASKSTGMGQGRLHAQRPAQRQRRHVLRRAWILEGRPPRVKVGTFTDDAIGRSGAKAGGRVWRLAAGADRDGTGWGAWLGETTGSRPAAGPAARLARQGQPPCRRHWVGRDDGRLGPPGPNPPDTWGRRSRANSISAGGTPNLEPWLVADPLGYSLGAGVRIRGGDRTRFGRERRRLENQVRRGCEGRRRNRLAPTGARCHVGRQFQRVEILETNFTRGRRGQEGCPASHGTLDVARFVWLAAEQPGHLRTHGRHPGQTTTRINPVTSLSSIPAWTAASRHTVSIASNRGRATLSTSGRSRVPTCVPVTPMSDAKNGMRHLPSPGWKG